MSTQRDFKNASGNSKPKRRRQPAKGRGPAKEGKPSAPAWLWLLTGLLIGLLVAGLLYIKQQREAHPAPAKVQQPAKSTAKRSAPAKTPEAEPPRFDFYEMLPEMEVEVPKGTPRPAEERKSSARYVLQAGSFRTLKQADALKAKLALLGFEATIQTVTVNGSSTWHRVHLGPYTGQKELNRVRARLWESQINTVPMRVSQ